MGNRNFAPIVIIILTIVIAGGIYMVKSGNPLFLKYFGGKSIAPTSTMVALGEVVKGFPKELILTTDAKIERSTTSRFEESKRTLVSVSYQTESKLNDLFAGYLNYFADNNFNVFFSDSKPSQSQIAARSPKYSVGVTMSYLHDKTYRVVVDVTIPDAQ